MTDHPDYADSPDADGNPPISRALTPDEVLDAPLEHAKYVLEQAAKSNRVATRNKAERLRVALVDLAARVRMERDVVEAEQAYRQAKQALRGGSDG
jgi:hypothetical protein